MMNRVPPQAQTYGFPTAAGLPLPGQQQQQLPGRAMASPQPPNKGTLVPGQVLRVGKIQVTVERYLSEGGFAHVYLVNTVEALQGSRTHVLKRVAVRDRKLLDEVRREVEVMKLLRGHPNIVHLHDADAFHLPDGTHEVLILMEFCAGGGIIDLLNSRLQSRLTEQEILQIFVDVCEGVAKMHSLRPKPLVHRDLKVENILQAGERTFKLCDFGSAAYPRPPPQTLQEIKEVELDINTHTTMQYRSPEMVDVYQRRPIDEKADIWALGVFLYKLCYYTTPFEEHGPLAILNVQYRVPPYPVYSNQLNLLVGSMLQEHGSQRPSAVQLLKTVHSMRGTRPANHYDEPVSSQTRGAGNDLFDIISSVGSPSPNPSPVAAITPMRRGRPTKLPAGAGSPQVPVPVANPAPPPNQGPAPAELSPQYTIPSTPLDPPVAGLPQRPEFTSRYTIPATPLEAPAAAAAPKLPQPTINVTGEKSPDPIGSQAKPVAASSWSSFGSASGSTSKPSPATTAAFDGFADLEEPKSPKAARTASSQTSGYSAFLPPSAQNSLGPPPSLPPRKPSSSSFSAASAFDGFADSFTDSFVPLSSSPQPMAGSPLLPRPASSASATVPLLTPSQGSQSSSKLDAPVAAPPGPAREPSFDERYPSVEQLDLRSGSTSPVASAAAPPAVAGNSAATRGFMPHAGRSYTGSAGQPTPSILDKEPVFPLPRSTQITGMAMRNDEEGKPQRPAQARAGGGGSGGDVSGDVSWGDESTAASVKGFSAPAPLDKRERPSLKQLEDWLTGDASPAQESATSKPALVPQTLPPAQRGLSSGSTSISLPPAVAAKPSTLSTGVPRSGSSGAASKGPRSPPPKAAKPAALNTPAYPSLKSEQRSPVEADRAKLSSTLQPTAPRPESSDDEPAMPESATRVAAGETHARADSSPMRSWSKPTPVVASKPEPSAAAQKAPSAYAPSTFASANAPRRLPTVDSDSAASFLRGSTSLGRSSTISATSTARSRPRPQSLYSSSSLGGAADPLKTESKLAPIAADDARSAAAAPLASHAPTAVAAVGKLPSGPLTSVPLIAPKPRRPMTNTNVAQRFERGSPLSPTTASTVGGRAPNGLSGTTAPSTIATTNGQSRTATLARQDLPPLKGFTPESTGKAEPQWPPSSSSAPAEGEAVEERKSVKSLISRWNQGH